MQPGSDRNPLQPPSFRVGGAKVSSVTLLSALTFLFELAESRAGGYVTVTSAHGIVEAQRDAKLMDIFEHACLSLPDGMPVFWAGRLIHGRALSRVPGAEFFAGALSGARSSGLRHFFYGGQPMTARRVVARAASTLGDSAIAGWHSPPMRVAGALEDADVVARMRHAAPDIIWVGLSAPKQEYWMANHAHLFPNAVLVGVGAAFDFYAGVKTRGPRVMSAIGLEWLYRAASEPRRLWPRYRSVVPKMVVILLRDASRALLHPHRGPA